MRHDNAEATRQPSARRGWGLGVNFALFSARGSKVELCLFELLEAAPN